MCVAVERSLFYSRVVLPMGFPSASAGDVGSIPGSGRSLGEGNDNHFSIPAWEIPWTEEPGGL